MIIIPVITTAINDLYQNKYNFHVDTYRITTALKVETDIIVNIAASLIGRAVILVIFCPDLQKGRYCFYQYSTS